MEKRKQQRSKRKAKFSGSGQVTDNQSNWDNNKIDSSLCCLQELLLKLSSYEKAIHGANWVATELPIGD
mgnify:CR=1 FL=1